MLQLFQKHPHFFTEIIVEILLLQLLPEEKEETLVVFLDETLQILFIFDILFL